MSFPLEMQRDSLTKYLVFKIIFQFIFFHLKKIFHYRIYKIFIAKQMDILSCNKITIYMNSRKDNLDNLTECKRDHMANFNQYFALLIHLTKKPIIKHLSQATNHQHTIPNTLEKAT